METRTLAQVRAADADTLYSLYFPEGRVSAAAAVGCVCLCVDYLTCSSQPPSHGVEGSDAAAGMADRLGPGSHPPADVVEGFEAAICSMVARLGLPAAVGERAKDVFRKMDEANAWPPGPGRRKDRSKGKRKGPLAYAACLSIACRTEGSARSLRELALAAACGGAAARKEIVRLVTHIRMRLGEEEVGQATGIGMVCPSSYVRRFGALARLGEADEAAALALAAARRLEGGALDVRHNPEPVAAAVVCLALERGGAARKPVKDVATATGIAYHTINRVCMILRPHAGRLFG
ncbi:transcription initiation factor IIB-like [Lolium perenne]|uniref:transcription initiation factor IIB-like n=1 Tax=Lolium perenne TaxID=4522 RepID=UPI0021F5F09C|nr:transcription initiation factor IIB-like [Lolium perenne]